MGWWAVGIHWLSPVLLSLSWRQALSKVVFIANWFTVIIATKYNRWGLLEAAAVADFMKGWVPSDGGPNSSCAEREREPRDLICCSIYTIQQGMSLCGVSPNIICIFWGSSYGLCFLSWNLYLCAGAPYWCLYSWNGGLCINRLCFGPQISKVLFGLTVTNLVLYQRTCDNTMNKFPFIQYQPTTPIYISNFKWNDQSVTQIEIGDSIITES
jgi:hypothetical protein